MKTATNWPPRIVYALSGYILQVYTVYLISPGQASPNKLFCTSLGLTPEDTVDLYNIHYVDNTTINISWTTKDDSVNLINLEYVCYVNSTEATVCVIIGNWIDANFFQGLCICTPQYSVS